MPYTLPEILTFVLLLVLLWVVLFQLVRWIGRRRADSNPIYRVTTPASSQIIDAEIIPPPAREEK